MNPGQIVLSVLKLVLAVAKSAGLVKKLAPTPGPRVKPID